MVQTPYGAPTTQMPMGAPPGAPVGQVQPAGVMGQIPMSSLPPGGLGGTMPSGKHKSAFAAGMALKFHGQLIAYFSD